LYTIINMISVPDSCTLIYLVKIDLLNILPKLFNEVWIGGVVYEECVIRGKEEQKSDAFILERIIEGEKFKIKELSSKEDFDKEKLYFVGPGETEVYILTKAHKDTVAITSDAIAYQKLIRRGINAIRADELLLEAFKRKIFGFDEFSDNLIKLQTVGGTTEERIAFLIKKALEVKKWKQK